MLVRPGTLKLDRQQPQHQRSVTWFSFSPRSRFLTLVSGQACCHPETKADPDENSHVNTESDTDVCASLVDRHHKVQGGWAAKRVRRVAAAPHPTESAGLTAARVITQTAPPAHTSSYEITQTAPPAVMTQLLVYITLSYHTTACSCDNSNGTTCGRDRSR
jgi:hypothetical protein